MASPTRRALLAAAAGALAGCQGPAGGSAAAPAASGRAPGAVPPARRAVPTPPGAGAIGAARQAPPGRAEVVAEFGRLRPATWGFTAPGTLVALPAEARARKTVALTFDACGGPGGSGYDQALIDCLRRREIPATLFLNARWIDANPAVFRRLAAEPLFEIANHGTRHRPLSVSGRSAYGIPGTRDAGEVYDEVAGNRLKLARLLGAPPRFFRSGTAYCDDVAVRIVRALGEQCVTFTVNGDGGATFTPAEVRAAVGAARPGDIVLCHMNHPEGGTARGIQAALPALIASGHRFVRLSEAVHSA